MKKITLLLSFMACVVLAQGQNLLVNPSFETWTAGKPDSWTIPTNTYATVSENTTLFVDGSKSFQVLPVTPATSGGTYSVSQSVSITPGKTYTLSMSYYIEAGDGTDARIWCNFKAGTTYFVEADVVATGLYSKLRGPGCETSQGTAYFPDEKGAWKTYTVEFVAPATADGFDFQFRTYKTPAVVSWDNFSLVEKVISGTSNPTANAFSAIVSGKNLLLKNAANGSTVEIFNALGAKVQTSELVNGSVGINNLTKGLYIVRVGKNAQKIML